MKKKKNDFTNYEKALIKEHINPKICILSNGEDWEYLNNLIMKFNANITILGADYKLLFKEENQKDYDLIIYQSTKNPISPEDNYMWPYALSTSSEKYNKATSIIRVSKYDDEHIRLNEAIALGCSIDSVPTKHITANNLREIIDIGLSNLIEYKKQNEEKHTLVKKR